MRKYCYYYYYYHHHHHHHRRRRHHNHHHHHHHVYYFILRFRSRFLSEFTRRSATGHCKRTTCPRSLRGGYKAGFEPATLRSKGIDSTIAPPRPQGYKGVFSQECSRVCLSGDNRSWRRVLAYRWGLLAFSWLSLPTLRLVKQVKKKKSSCLIFKLLQ